MLAITEDAATAIDSIVASSGLPEGAGLRITQEVSTQRAGRRGPTFACRRSSPPRRATRCSRTSASSSIPEAADFLDDKLLDADVDGDEVRFSLDIQAESR